MAGTGFTSGSDGTMPQIVKTDDILGGDPRIEDHRIGVYQVYRQYVESDQTPEAIATSYDISVAESTPPSPTPSAIPTRCGKLRPEIRQSPKRRRPTVSSPTIAPDPIDGPAR